MSMGIMGKSEQNYINDSPGVGDSLFTLIGMDDLGYLSVPATALEWRIFLGGASELVFFMHACSSFDAEHVHVEGKGVLWYREEKTYTSLSLQPFAHL
jgi:hypothetical protein